MRAVMHECVESIDIAGVRFVVAGEGAAVRPWPDAAYAAFVNRPAADAVDRFTVRVVPTPAPLPADAVRVFAAGESWSIWRVAGDRWLRSSSPAAGVPLWTARLDAAAAEAVVFCGDRLVDDGGARTTVMNPVHYPLDQILLVHALAPRRGALVHAAGLALNGAALIFPGVSGAGKSCLVRQFLAAGRGEPLSDDRVVLREWDGDLAVFGTPWPGEAAVAANTRRRLRALIFLRHARHTQVRSLDRAGVAARLLPAVSVLWFDAAAVASTLSFCDALVRRIPAFELCFRPDTEVVDVLCDLAARL